MSNRDNLYNRVQLAFDHAALKRVCEMHENEFADAYDMRVTPVKQKAPANFYLHRDNGADILAVAHLDTVGLHYERTANFINTAGGPVIYSRALDDRLGAYTILELLPTLGINVDLLLTVGEESGSSTAAFFDTEKEYNWMIEFDRGGTDVVMYQFEDRETRELVRDCGARVGDGIFSDISYLSHLEVKGFNWGVGYRDYHGPRAHAYLEDYWMMIGYYLEFHDKNSDVYLPHDSENEYSQFGSRYYSWWDRDKLDDDRGFLGEDEPDGTWVDDPDEAMIDADIADFAQNHPDLISEDFDVVNRILSE